MWLTGYPLVGMKIHWFWFISLAGVMYAYYAYFRLQEGGLNEVGTEEKFLSPPFFYMILSVWYDKDKAI